ncbi:2-oxoglutarate dehydrogenase complex dihydrolipoyllysine-residue succinyltransferase [soil metagenome]
MAIDIKIPGVGESVTEVVVAHWFKKDGELVQKDEPFVELETDKINQEISAPETGVLKHNAKEGDTLPVGAIIASIDPTATAENSAKKAAPAPKEKEIVKPTADEPTTAAKAIEAVPIGKAPKASSVAKKVAAELSVELGKVEGHGIGGRIMKNDVESHATTKTEPAAAKAAAPAGERAVTRERMSTLRKRIATRLVEAQHTAAILTTFNEVDMTAVMEMRARQKDSFQKKHGVGLGFMSFFVKACIEALREFPRVNAFIENDETVYHHYNDIGVAVGTEKGLVVPIIRNAETLSFAGIEQAIRGYAEKAKTGKLTVDDLTGGTFTISNGGVYGSMMSTPILNPPQSGILGMHNIIKRPVAINDQVVIRPMMYLALSYDHRIVDGKEAVGFLLRVKECIEAPERMLLNM